MDDEGRRKLVRAASIPPVEVDVHRDTPFSLILRQFHFMEGDLGTVAERGLLNRWCLRAWGSIPPPSATLCPTGRMPTRAF